MSELPLDLELPEDSPTWGDPPETSQEALYAWRMERTIWERVNGRERERDRPNPEPFEWID